MTSFSKKLIATALTTLVLCTGAAAQQSVTRGVERATTLWWVIFNEPANCTANPGAQIQCGSQDVFGQAFLDSIANGAPDPSLLSPNLASKIGVVYGTGALTNGHGQVRLAASIYRSEEDGNHNLPSGADPMGLKRAFENPNAEIHLVVRDHGAVNTQDYLPQITNFLDPYCSDPNLLYFAGKNTCADTHFAVFGGAESGTRAVYAFADGQPVSRAKANLWRDEDALRVVIETRLSPLD